MATFFAWRAKFGGAAVAEFKRLKALEQGISRLKRMYADRAMENAAIERSSVVSCDASRGAAGDCHEALSVRRAC